MQSSVEDWILASIGMKGHYYSITMNEAMISLFPIENLKMLQVSYEKGY